MVTISMGGIEGGRKLHGSLLPEGFWVIIVEALGAEAELIGGDRPFS